VSSAGISIGHAQGVVERVQFGGVVGAHGVVQAEPQLRELACAIHHDAGTGVAGVGLAGAVIKRNSSMGRASELPSWEMLRVIGDELRV